MDVTSLEDGVGGWRSCAADLSGVALVISDDHVCSLNAIASVLLRAAVGVHASPHHLRTA